MLKEKLKQISTGNKGDGETLEVIIFEFRNKFKLIFY